jgi:hypothetical protein
MRRHAILLGFAILALGSIADRVAGQSVVPAATGAAPSSAPTLLSTPGTAAISGAVIDAATGRPAAGAIVSLGNTAALDAPFPRAVADSRGRFVFLDLPASATYMLSAIAAGYASSQYGWTTPNGEMRDTRRVALSDGQWVSTIEIPIWRLGSITGRIIDERGDGVVASAVRAFSVANIGGQRQWVQGALATTDDRGVYRLDDLNPGRYAVGVLSVQSTVLASTSESPQRRPIGKLDTTGIAGSSGSTVATATIDVDGRHRLALTNFVTPPAPAADRARAYPALFYPSARSLADSALVDIGFGDSRGGIDVQLGPVPAVRLSGHIEGFSGPAPSLLLRLLPAGSEQLGFGSEAATTLIEPDGRFTFLNVPEGSYTILAQASFIEFTSSDPYERRLAEAPGFPAGGLGVGSYPAAPGLVFLDHLGSPAQFWGRAPVTVGAAGLDDLALPMHPAVSVRGRVVFSEGTTVPAANRRLVVFAIPANGDPTLGRPIGFSETDGSFRFSLSGLLGGTYLVSGFGGFSILSIVHQGRDFTDAGFDGSTGRDYDDVVVTLTEKRTTLSGAVRDRQAGRDAAVIAFPVERERWTNFGMAPRRVVSTQSASSGAYQFASLPAGDYYVIAVDSSRKNAWVEPGFLAAAAPLATRVTLKWGETVAQDLSIREVIVK